MSISERIPDAQALIKQKEATMGERSRELKLRDEQRRRKTIEEIKTQADALAERVNLHAIFEEVKEALSKEGFDPQDIEINKAISFQREDIGWYSASCEWTVSWAKPGDREISSFSIKLMSDPHFSLRVSGGGTGETTTDFCFRTVEEINVDRFEEAVALALVKPLEPRQVRTSL